MTDSRKGRENAHSLFGRRGEVEDITVRTDVVPINKTEWTFSNAVVTSFYRRIKEFQIEANKIIKELPSLSSPEKIVKLAAFQKTLDIFYNTGRCNKFKDFEDRGFRLALKNGLAERFPKLVMPEKFNFKTASADEIGQLLVKALEGLEEEIKVLLEQVKAEQPGNPGE